MTTYITCFFSIFEQQQGAMNYIHLSISFLLLLSPLQEYRHILDSTESLLNTNPNLSLELIQTVPMSALKTNSQRARYALLMSEALYDNYFDTDSDSLIRIALDYYDRSMDHNRKMRSCFFEGIALCNMQEYTTAAIYFEKAIKEALYISDSLFLGRAYRELGNIMTTTNNNAEAIRYGELSVRYFGQQTEKPYQQYGLLSLAVAYANNKQYDYALALLNNLISDTSDSTFSSQCKIIMAEILLETGSTKYSDILSIYQTARPDLLFLTDYGYYAYVFEMLGCRDSSDYYLNLAYKLSKDYPDTATIHSFHARIEKNRGNYKHAYTLLERACDAQDSVTRAILQQSISVAQRDFFNKEAQYQEFRANVAKHRVLIAISICLLLLFIIGLIAFINVKRKEYANKELMSMLAHERQKTNQLFEEKAAILGSLFCEKIGHLNCLVEDYFSAETKEAKDLIYKEYKKKRAMLQNDDALYSSLEYDLNKYCDGIMEKLRMEVPKLRERHLRTISLFFAGVPNITVQLITGRNSINAIEMERSRFKKTIRESCAPHAQMFLDLIEVKKTAFRRNAS